MVWFVRRFYDRIKDPRWFAGERLNKKIDDRHRRVHMTKPKEIHECIVQMSKFPAKEMDNRTKIRRSAALE